MECDIESLRKQSTPSLSPLHDVSECATSESVALVGAGYESESEYYGPSQPSIKDDAAVSSGCETVTVPSDSSGSPEHY